MRTEAVEGPPPVPAQPAPAQTGPALAPGLDAESYELHRLAALHRLGVLDTEPERAFDDLTQLAAQLCGMPLSVVSLVDTDRQWFKSRYGVDVCETPREVSFCARALTGPDLLVVPDTRLDSRFADFPNVVREERPMRSYVGAPLITRDGYVLGTLCVSDHVPRTLSERQLSQLVVLARQVVSQLELRGAALELAEEVAARAAAEAELRDSRRLTDGVLAHTDVGIFAKDLGGRYLLANPAVSRLLGSGDSVLGRTDADLFSPEQAVAYGKHDATVVATGRRKVFREQAVAVDGRSRRYLSVKFPLLDAAGEVYAVAGVSTDVTELEDERRARAESEQRWRALVEHSPVGVAVIGPDARFSYANPPALALVGASRPEDMIGCLAADFVPRRFRRESARYFQTLLHGGEPLIAARRSLVRLDGTQLDIDVSVVPITHLGQPALQLELRDMSAQAAAEEALRAANEELATRQAFTDAVLDSVDVGIVACDAQGRITVFNHATRAWHGTARTDLDDGQALVGSFPMLDAEGQPLESDRSPLHRVLVEGVLQDAECLISPHGLLATRVLCSGRALSAPDGRVIGAVVAMTDVTAARAQTRALEQSEQRFRTTFAGDPAGLALLSPSGRALQVNPALCRLLDRDEAELLALTDLRELSSPADAAVVTGLARRAFEEPGATLDAERLVLLADGRQLWVLITVTEMPDPQEERCLLLQLEDISGRKTAELALTHQALYDNLTDLPNRVMLLDRTTRALARLARRPQDGIVAMLFCDLDGFKAVNDHHGHAAGDAVLVEVARRLAAAMRPTDTVARLGGDEFVVLCDRLGSPDEGLMIAERLEAAVAEPVAWEGGQVTVSMSIGIAHGSARGQAGSDARGAAEELMRSADSAMYAAKRLSRRALRGGAH